MSGYLDNTKGRRPSRPQYDTDHVDRPVQGTRTLAATRHVAAQDAGDQIFGGSLARTPRDPDKHRVSQTSPMP